jgi:hypothetical protein
MSVSLEAAVCVGARQPMALLQGVEKMGCSLNKLREQRFYPPTPILLRRATNEFRHLPRSKLGKTPAPSAVSARSDPVASLASVETSESVISQ